MRLGNLITPARWLRRDHNAAGLAIGLMMLVSLACNAFAGNYEPFPEPPELATTVVDTATPAALAATATLAEMQETAQANVTMLVDLNIRSGPGVDYDRIGFLSAGTVVPAAGVDPQTGWWKIACPAAVDGSECWVSGGSQYVAVEQGESVPTAVAPATPTIPPPTVALGQGWLAYTSDGRLYVAGLSLGGAVPVLASDGMQVSAGADVQQFAFAPDGRRIAYVAGDDSGNGLHIVNVDGSDHRTMVVSSILPVATAPDANESRALIAAIQWLPQGDGVAFNTKISSQVGPGGSSQEDLWIVTMDGQLLERFSAGDGGGSFLFTEDDQVLLSRMDAIARAERDRGKPTIIVEFAAINTASEYAYYPLPQVTDGGIYVSIPAPEPRLDGAETTLWRLPADGPGLELGQVTDVVLEQPVYWSTSGERTAFVREADSDEQPAVRLLTANEQGNDAVPYAGSTGMSFFAWNPVNDRFLYAGAGFYAVGRPEAPPQQILLPIGLAAGTAQWSSSESYILAINDAAARQWEIRSANVAGDVQSLVNGTGPAASFAVWLP